jgi:ATP-binding cassette subfamily B (MDR/TAP) protein 1
VAAATGLTSSQLIVSCTNLVGSVILAFILSWKAAVVVLAPLVILFFSSWANVVMLERYESEVSVPAGKAASYVAENVDAMKEIAALGRELEVMRRFDEQARTEPKRTQYLIWGAGGFAISQVSKGSSTRINDPLTLFQMAVLAVSALIFYWAGARLYADGEISQTNLYALFEAGVIGVFSAGRLLTFVPDLGRALSAFRKIVGWSERKPRVAQLPLTDQPFTGIGDIVFSDVELRYPQRPDHPALTGLNLVIKSGQTHAFVGPSGAGKSTILQMVARFYDPAFGTVSVGGIDVRTVPVEVFREKIGLVSQDPVLIRWVFPALRCSAQVLTASTIAARLAGTSHSARPIPRA